MFAPDSASNELTWLGDYLGDLKIECDETVLKKKDLCPSWKLAMWKRLKHLKFPPRESAEDFLEMLVQSGSTRLLSELKQAKDYPEKKNLIASAALGCELGEMNRGLWNSIFLKVKECSDVFIKSQSKRKREIESQVSTLKSPLIKEDPFSSVQFGLSYQIRHKIVTNLYFAMKSFDPTLNSMLDMISFSPISNDITPFVLTGKNLRTLIVALVSQSVRSSVENRFDEALDGLLENRITADENPALDLLCKKLNTNSVQVEREPQSVKRSF